MDKRFEIWGVLFLLFVLLSALRSALRRKAQTPLARLDAAAKKILQEQAQRQVGQSPNSKRAKPQPGRGPKPKPARTAIPAVTKPASEPAIFRTNRAPAVQRRTGFLAGSREPVIQRRR